MDQTDLNVEEAEGLRNGVELVTSVSDKHLDLLRPSARYYSMFKVNKVFIELGLFYRVLSRQVRGIMVMVGQATDGTDWDKGKYALIRDVEDFQSGIYDKPLPCFGCGIGWFSFLLGFVFPLMWYYGTFLYFGNHYRKDPRERAGLAASAIAALVCSMALLIIALILMF